LESTYIDNQIDQGIEVGDGAAIAHSWSLDAKFFGLAVDAFCRGALRIDGMVEWTVAIQGDAHLPTQFPIDILDAAFALRELLVLTGGSCLLWKQQGTAEALGAIAVGIARYFP